MTDQHEGIYTFMDCPKRHYFEFLNCHMAGCRPDLIIECKSMDVQEVINDD